MLQNIQSALINLRLGKKLTILLLLVFIGGIVVSGASLATILNRNAQNQITSKALILMEIVNSVRDYTNTQVSPELADKLESKFIPQALPAFSAREVFEMFRADKTYKEFFYKDATLNPSNLRNKADSFEKVIVERFRKESNLKELRGFRSSGDGKVFYIARPLAVSNSSCLQCHSTPDVAPKSVTERYGTTHGFGWKLNEIISAQMIYVPASTVIRNARQSFVWIMGLVAVIFAAVIFLVNRWLNRYVVRPINRMAQVAESVSTGDTDTEFEWVSNDEVGSLAEAFTRMKMSLVMAMKRLDKYSSGHRSTEHSQQ